MAVTSRPRSAWPRQSRQHGNLFEMFMFERQPAVYIMANKYHGTIYTGVTSDLLKRVYQHKHHEMAGFTKRYSCHFLVWYELYDEMYGAIEREKQIKAGSRKKKIELIERSNSAWHDLYQTLG
jgi:putative endonuclease